MTRTKRMKLPNGFGQISLLKGNLRNPYRAMITVGHTADGRPICKLLKPVSYFKTYNDAYAALIEQNRNPYDARKDITFKELYQDWFKVKAQTKTNKNMQIYKNGFNKLEAIHDMRVRDIKPMVIREEIEKYRHISRGPKDIKMTLNLLFDYAVENEIVNINYARNTKVNVTPEVKNHHITFTDEEMNILWDHSKEEIVQIALIQCYTGMRPGELCSITLKNIDLEQNIIVGGSKTKAGINRRIPIHPSILKFIKGFMKNASRKNFDFLFSTSVDTQMTVEYYRRKYKQMIKDLKLNPEHKAHDPRKYFITQAKKYKLDEYAIKLIVGHAIEDITENVYTDRSTEWLYQEILKIPCRNNV